MREGERQSRQKRCERERGRAERRVPRGREMERRIDGNEPGPKRTEEQPEVFQSETFAYHDFDEWNKFCVVYLIVQQMFMRDGSCVVIVRCEQLLFPPNPLFKDLTRS